MLHNDDTNLVVKIVSSLSLLSNQITAFILYRFLIALREVRVKLESESIAQYSERLRHHQILVLVIYACFFILQVPLVVLRSFIKICDPQPDILIILNYTRLLLLSLFTILDFVMFAMFMGLIRFFSDKKKEMLALHGGSGSTTSSKKVQLSRFTRFIIKVSIILALLNLEDQLAQLTFCIMSISPSVDFDWKGAELYQQRIIIAVIDFITSSALLYLFYSQGMKHARDSKQVSDQ